MPIVAEIGGDIIDIVDKKRGSGHDKFSAIAHGCNCFCTMGSGIAVPISAAFHDVRKADNRTKEGDASKLGSFSIATQPDGFRVYNLYTQFEYGTEKRHVNYEAIASCFEKMNDYLMRWENVLIPQIGAGLAGGDWEIIRTIIHRVTEFNVTVVHYCGHK